MNHRDRNKVRAASFDDTFAIGINSGLADYKLAWMINKKVSIGLTRQEDIFADGMTYAFYYYTAGENSHVYNLVSIKSRDLPLIEFKTNLDYLMVVRNGIVAERVDAIVRSLREIEGVGHAFLLDVNKGKSIRQALEIIELQEIYLINESKRRNTVEYARQQLLRQREANLPSKTTIFAHT